MKKITIYYLFSSFISVILSIVLIPIIHKYYPFKCFLIVFPIIVCFLRLTPSDAHSMVSLNGLFFEWRFQRHQ